VFAATLLVYGLATGAAALSWSVGALLLFRFLIGLGLGAELPVAATLVSEFAPARIRGRVVVALEAFWAVGWLLAALIGYFVVSASDEGWRWALAVGAVPALYSAFIRFGLPESVRFLEQRGRQSDAEIAVRRFESAAGVAPPEAPARATGEAAPVPGPGALWRPVQRRQTASLWLVWFGVSFSYYGAFIWLPTLLVASGMSLARSFGFALVITLAQLPGYATAAVLVERCGRRPTLSLFLAGSAGSAFAFGLADTTTTMVAGGMALSFFNLGAWGALYAITLRSTRRRCGRPEQAGRRASGGSDQFWPRCRCHLCSRSAAAHWCSGSSPHSSSSPQHLPGVCPSAAGSRWRPARSEPLSSAVTNRPIPDPSRGAPWQERSDVPGPLIAAQDGRAVAGTRIPQGRL
jgi:MFS family permease